MSSNDSYFIISRIYCAKDQIYVQSILRSLLAHTHVGEHSFGNWLFPIPSFRFVGIEVISKDSSNLEAPL